MKAATTQLPERGEPAMPIGTAGFFVSQRSILMTREQLRLITSDYIGRMNLTEGTEAMDSHENGYDDAATAESARHESDGTATAQPPNRNADMPQPSGVRLLWQPLTASPALYNYSPAVGGECEGCGLKADAKTVLVEVSPMGCAVHYQCPNCGHPHLLAVYEGEEAFEYHLPDTSDIERSLRVICMSADNPAANYEDWEREVMLAASAIANGYNARIRRLARLLLAAV